MVRKMYKLDTDVKAEKVLSLVKKCEVLILNCAHGFDDYNLRYILIKALGFLKYYGVSLKKPKANSRS